MTETVRVVPSGKVYRQIFDAQVQLVNSLEKTKESRTSRVDIETANKNGSKPVVRESRALTEGTGILTERQKTWITGFPNEASIENPVLYKQIAHYSVEVKKEPRASLAGREVRGLPDVVVSAKIGSDIIDRIAESRRERHDATLEDMHQELGIISSDIEPRIIEAGEEVVNKLEESGQDIQCTLSQIERNEGLLYFTLDGLHELWESVQSESTVRREWIDELDETLTKIEDERMQQIQVVFKEYANTLDKIAHLMAPDLNRLMDKEAQAINQTVLSNRRAFCDLYTKLMTADIDREKRQHTHWRKRVEDWKSLNIDNAIKKFSCHMDSDVVVKPPGVERVLQYMAAEQRGINKRRLDLITSLKDLKPPASTKPAIETWNRQLVTVSEQIDQLNQSYLEKLHKEYETVCQECLQKIDNVKKSLIQSGACSESKAQIIIEDKCLPLLGERQRMYEENLQDMDKAFEDQNNYLREQLKLLYKFAHGCAHVWDVHEIGLGKQERTLQDQLDTCRHTHDNQNQEKEGNLDITMDKMRQESNEKALKESLQKALEMMDKIKQGYDEFHHQQLEIVQGYPHMVQEELATYDRAVCKYFSVHRTHPSEVTDTVTEENVSPRSSEGRRTPTRPRSRSKKKKKTSSRAGSRPGSTTSIESVSSPIPMDVMETLTTCQGTIFYVLGVAGEQGVGPPGEQGVAPPREGTSVTFLTENVQHTDTAPIYLQHTNVNDSFILEVKKALRLNFLNHLEDWSLQAMDRTGSVVAAKSEELYSELDLRLHLHKPRARRAELDVHNVRAAELLMHSERVSRHCKGINHSLTELKIHFAHMTSEHNKLADKFREEIEALEVVFINATKSAKLVALQNQLSVELDQYMTVIRASLRKFRQHLDDTLQMLRESNARFIKSFKVFSDGGNFCPEEIEEYRKKLEKMSHKIDAAEGFIMTDLEGMESKRLDHATKVSSEFEDRFKNHMMDLVFMEKIARWLTNTQVKIKAEVAESNSQAQTLAQYLTDLDRRIDACERPNLDKEQITPTQLNESLKAIFESFHCRSIYLDCLKDLNERPMTPLQGPPAVAVARVGFVADVTTPLTISKAGKQPIEDPSVGVIKSILAPRSQKRFGMDAELDGAISSQGPPTKTALDDRDKMMKSSASRPNTTLVDKSKMGASRPNTTLQGAEKARSPAKSRRGTATTIATSDTPKRAHSGTFRRSNKLKFDKKLLIFGEKNEEGEESHVLGRIKRILREALDGLLVTSEMYYRQKGSRAVTRPQALKDTFEDCTLVVLDKLESYYKQSDEYHNLCLQEFRAQLDRLEDLIARIPALVINEVLKRQLEQTYSDRRNSDALFNTKLTELDKQKFEHKNLLRPSLGHPHLVDEMRSLCESEEERRGQYLEGVQDHTSHLQECAVSHAREFVDQLARTSEQILLQFDNLLTVDDVKRGRIEPTKYPTSELIRRNKAGLPLEDDNNVDKLPRGKSTWQGIVQNELICGDRPKKVKMTASITAAKTTLGHHASVKARDNAYQEYKKQFEKLLLSIENHREKHLHTEQHWTDSWLGSVDKVKQLY